MRQIQKSQAARSIMIAGLAAALIVTVMPSAHAGPPSNDDIATAEEIVGLPATDTVDVDEASGAANDPVVPCGNNSQAKSVWFKHTPEADVRLEADTVGSNYDTILTVFEGSPGDLDVVACNDDFRGQTSKVFFDAGEDDDYFFMVTSYTGSGGTLSFSLREASDELELSVSVEDIGWAAAIGGRGTITGEVTCSREVQIHLELVVSQENGDYVRSGYGDELIECDGTNRWLSTTYAAGFKKGAAQVEVEAYVTGETEEATATQSIVLRECTIIGTLDDDTIRGSRRNDKICSLAGNDVIYGGAGNDELRGHDGDDHAVGGSGDDILTGGYGSDNLNGGSGNDKLLGDFGDDVLNGGDGTDKCIGGTGNNRKRGCE